MESGADAGWQPVEGSARELSTRFGLLTVVYRDGREGRTGAVDVLLNGQRIRPAFERSGDYGYVYFQNRFELGSQDVVVLSASAGGSGSPPPLLHVIVLGPDDERRVVSDPRFRSVDGTQSVAADRGRLRFDLGYENGRRKTAVFDGDELTVDYRSVEPTPISVEQCSALYEIVVEECTPRGALTQLDGVPVEEFLSSPSAPLSNASRRRLRSMMHHPGFQPTEFIDICVAAAEIRQAPSAALFSSAVCDRP